VGPAGTLLVLDDLQWAGADANQRLQKHGAAYTLYRSFRMAPAGFSSLDPW
jgi:hypothetical protein